MLLDVAPLQVPDAVAPEVILHLKLKLPPPVHVSIAARASQMEAIDRLARLAGMTRSALLVQAAIRDGGAASGL